MIGPILSSVRDLRADLPRSLASLLGVIIAITAVFLVDATTTASSAASTSYLEREFGLSVTLEVPVADHRQGRAIFAALGQNGIRLRSLVQAERLVVLRGDRQVTTEGRLILAGSQDIYPDDLVAGSAPRHASSNLSQVVLDTASLSSLGLTVADAVGSSVDLVDQGDSATFDGARVMAGPAVVVGVHRSSPSGDPLTVVRGGGFDPQAQTSVLVRVDPDDIDLVRSSAQTVSPQAETERLDEFDKYGPLMKTEAELGHALSYLVLVIGGAGLLATRIALVRERRVELGIRRALGASRGAIVTAVVAEALLVTLLASFASLIVAWAIFLLLPADILTNGEGSVTRLTLPAASVVRGVVGAGIIGLVAALIPASIASRTSIVESVRR